MAFNYSHALQYCIIKGCPNGRKTFKDKGHRYFCLPKIDTNDKLEVQEKTTRRLLAWCIAINRKEVNVINAEKGFVWVCSRHFIKGEPASLADERDPDWIPNQALSHSDPALLELLKHRKPKKVKNEGKSRKRMAPKWTPKLRGWKRSKNSKNKDNEKQQVDESSGSATEDDSFSPHANSLEIPVMNSVVRQKVMTVLQSLDKQAPIQSKCNEPLLVLTAKVKQDKTTIQWYCDDEVNKKRRFQYRTSLLTQYEQSSTPQYASQDEDDMEKPYIKVICNSTRAILHMHLFLCPGLGRKCLELDDGSYITPEDMIFKHYGLPPIYWASLISLEDGTPLSDLMMNHELEFTNHTSLCTQLCMAALTGSKETESDDQLGESSKGHLQVNNSSTVNKTILQNGIMPPQVLDLDKSLQLKSDVLDRASFLHFADHQLLQSNGKGPTGISTTEEIKSRLSAKIYAKILNGSKPD